MEYHNFNTLEELEQADAAWNQGALLAERFEDFHSIQLYQLEDYYIEVTRHQHFNVILQVATFKDTARLEPYLKTINIDGLLNP